MKSLVHWKPFHELDSLQRQMNRVVDTFLGKTPLMPFEENLSDWEFGPPVDIYEDNERLTFKVEVPGIDERDIKVEVEDNVLTVRGERKLETDVKKEENFRHMERHYGAFSRSFTLPSSVDPEKIDASYVHGVLAIQIPKRAGARPKQIKVNATKALKAAQGAHRRAFTPLLLTSARRRERVFEPGYPSLARTGEARTEDE